MEASSMNSRTTAKHSTKSTKRSARNVAALTPADALGMLASAITYLQQSGLTVKAGNDAQLGLVLAIDGARMSQDAFGVMTFEPALEPPDALKVGSTPTAELAGTTSTSEIPAQAHG
jgi:hypothetical protein